MVLINGEEEDDTPCKVFVRYKSKFIKRYGGREWDIINSYIYEFNGWKEHILKKLDNNFNELIFSEVQLIKPK